MNEIQKKILQRLLNLSFDHGFSSFPLLPIADELGISDPLYDNETNSGILWPLGPNGSGLICASGNWPDAIASIDPATVDHIRAICDNTTQ